MKNLPSQADFFSDNFDFDIPVLVLGMGRFGKKRGGSTCEPERCSGCGKIDAIARPIVVDGQPFRWRFDDVLVVIPGDRSGPQLYVDWGWRDWLEPEGPGAEPLVVTPRFVAEAVRFAAAHGWPSVTVGRPLRLGFQGGSFTLVAKSAEPGAAADGGA